MNAGKHRVSLVNGFWINDWNYNLRVLLVIMAGEILLAYSPFGYIVLPFISTTTLFIGVLIAALWGGPFLGAAVGLIFGLTSMWEASVNAVNPNDLIFSPIRSGNPMGSVLLAIGPRVLFGVIAGFVYFVCIKWIPRKGQIPVVMVVSVLLERIYTALVYLFIDQIFQVEGIKMADAWTNLISRRSIFNYTILMLVMLGIYLLYDRFLSKKYYEQFLQFKDNLTKCRPKYLVMMFVAIATILLTAMHLWDRVQIILFEIDQISPEKANADLILQVIIQYVVAIIAGTYMIIVLFRHARNIEEIEHSKAILQCNWERRRAEEMELSSMKDTLTGVYNRKGLRSIVNQDKWDERPIGFLLIDVDLFKVINDNFGHETGDAVLIEVAKSLKVAFGEQNVFRIGGDEFVVLIEIKDAINKSEMMAKWGVIVKKLAHIHKHVSKLLAKDTQVTLSGGVCFSQKGYGEGLYPLADGALYKTKNNGRAGCTLVDKEGNVLASWKDESVNK